MLSSRSELFPSATFVVVVVAARLSEFISCNFIVSAEVRYCCRLGWLVGWLVGRSDATDFMLFSDYE